MKLLEELSRKRSQTQKDKYYIIPPIQVTWNSQLIATENRMMVAGAWGGGRGSEELLFNRQRVSFWDAEKVLEKDGGDGCTTM